MALKNAAEENGRWRETKTEDRGNLYVSEVVTSEKGKARQERG
jgi:hypothetical protein